MSTQILSIQALRGAAALMVVAFHAAVLSNDYMSGAIYSPWMLVGKAGVDLFFVISGFIMVYTTRGHIGQPGAATRFAVSRVSRVYPPYWLLSLPLLALWLYSPGSVNSKTGGVDPVASFLLLPSHALPLVPVAWTLVHEMFFYLVFWALMVVGRPRVLIPALMAWGGCCLVNAAAGIPIGGIAASPYNVEFITGALLAHFGARKLGGAVFAAGLLWFAAVAAWFQSTAHGESIHLAARVALFGPPAAALVYGLVAWERNGRHVPAWLAWVGDWSYSLYLVHILVLHAVYRIATRKLPGDWSNPLSATALAIIGCVLALVASWLFFRFIERPVSARVRSWLTSATAWPMRRAA